MGYYELKAKEQKIRIKEKALILKGEEEEARKLRKEINSLKAQRKELGVPENKNPYGSYEKKN